MDIVLHIPVDLAETLILILYEGAASIEVGNGEGLRDAQRIRELAEEVRRQEGQ